MIEVGTSRETSFRYILPFALFLAVLAISRWVPLDPKISTPLWFVVFIPVCLLCWPRSISIVPRHWLGSIAIGLAVFVIWISPEVLIPGYRKLPLFSNPVLGQVHSSLPEAALRSPWVLAWRTARATLIVPIVEEIFWRAWLMRWLVNPDFRRVPLGTYTPLAFWVTAILFASEHGSYWDVGLICGVIYNLWMIRTKSVADCVLMHAVTNGVLSAYVILTGNWRYWQ
jgi:uncharacterized protein